jgi:PqqD family protein of HPr-rel-A system
VVWQLTPIVSLHWRRWDDEFVVFDVGSGQTHQLPPITAATLMLLELTSANLVELTSRVSSELSIDSDEQLVDGVREAVLGLESVGLIEFVT